MQKDPFCKAKPLFSVKGAPIQPQKGQEVGWRKREERLLTCSLPCPLDTGCIFQGLTQAGGETKMGVWLQGTMMLRTKNQQHSCTPISNVLYNTNFMRHSEIITVSIINVGDGSPRISRYFTSLRVLALILALWQPSALGSNTPLLPLYRWKHEAQ